MAAVSSRHRRWSNWRQEAYFAYHRINGGSLGRIYRRLEADDRARTWESDRTENLRRLLSHAATSVPYYAALLPGSEAEAAADPIATLRRLPPLTKETIRSRFGDLCSRDIAARGSYEQTSGGSTGEPVRLIQDAHFRDAELAVAMLYSTWAGHRYGEPEVWIWGSERDIRDGSVGARSRLESRLARRSYYNAFRMTPETMRDCLDRLRRDRPKLIVAYAHTLDDLAAFALREGIGVAPQRAIICTASTLHPAMRERIEGVFGCRAFNQYGSREVGDIAGECGRHQGLHLLPWMNFVEIVDEDLNPVAAGEEGRVLVTSLCNYSMPLIRYEIGDRARLVPEEEPPCPCGRRGPRIAEVVGRVGDTFVALDGSHVASGYFVHLLFFRDFIERFQVVQRAPSLVVYRLVTSFRPAPEELEEITKETRAVMGSSCEVQFEFPDDLRPSASGKFRYTVSEC